MMAVPVVLASNGQDVDVSEPAVLFAAHATDLDPSAELSQEYVVSADGQRLLIRLPRELPPPEPIKVILHWKPPWN